MMNLIIDKGGFKVLEGKRYRHIAFNDYVFINNKYRFDYKKYFETLPPVKDVYDRFKDYPQEEIIDRLIALYFPLRFLNVGRYADMALTIGLIGMRGTGKTCGAVMIAICDYLLRGKPVWSNVPIHIKVRYRDAEKEFVSNDLSELDMLDISKDYSNGLVVYDEVNMEAAEGARYNSAANLQFSYAMQQTRKRHMDVIWTCQGWNWIDNRLRWQTDYVLACRDATLDTKYYRPGSVGDNSVWRIHDLSGISGKFDYDYELKHRYLTDYIIGTHIVFMRPFWNAYSTEQLLGQNNYIEIYKNTQAEKKKAQKDKLPEGSKWKTYTELIEWMKTQDIVDSDYVEGNINANGETRSILTKLGKMLSEDEWKRIKVNNKIVSWERI